MKRVVLLMAALSLSSACTVRFISEHDPVLDAKTTQMHEEWETFLFKLEERRGEPAGTFAESREFYRRARAELASAKLRAESQPQSELLVREYTLLAANLEQLAKLHEAGGDKGLSAAVLGPAREALRTQFRALTQLHTALRRGEKR